MFSKLKYVKFSDFLTELHCFDLSVLQCLILVAAREVIFIQNDFYTLRRTSCWTDTFSKVPFNFSTCGQFTAHLSLSALF